MSEAFIPDELVTRLRVASSGTALMAVEAVKTAGGAQRVYYAERLGHNRRVVTRAAERRIAQLRQEMPDGQVTRLVAEGRAVETASLPRVVAGVGSGIVRRLM